MYVCVCVCMYVCITEIVVFFWCNYGQPHLACMYICMYIHTYVCITEIIVVFESLWAAAPDMYYVCMYVSDSMYVCTHICMYVCNCMYVCMHACICVQINAA